MRTTINIPDDLLQKVMAFSPSKTRSGAIADDLRAYLKQVKKERLLALKC